MRASTVPVKWTGKEVLRASTGKLMLPYYFAEVKGGKAHHPRAEVPSHRRLDGGPGVSPRTAGVMGEREEPSVQCDDPRSGCSSTASGLRRDLHLWSRSGFTLLFGHHARGSNFAPRRVRECSERSRSSTSSRIGIGIGSSPCRSACLGRGARLRWFWEWLVFSAGSTSGMFESMIGLLGLKHDD